MVDLRDALEQKMAEGAIIEQQEKGLIDSLFARDELAFGRVLVSKTEYKKEDFPKMMDLAFGRELKLHNLDKFERYILGKYGTIWLADIFKMTEEMIAYKSTASYKALAPESRKQFDECLAMTERYAKWSLETFQYWTRSSLSLGLKGFLEALKQKFEVIHDDKRQGVDIK